MILFTVATVAYTQIYAAWVIAHNDKIASSAIADIKAMYDARSKDWANSINLSKSLVNQSQSALNQAKRLSEQLESLTSEDIKMRISKAEDRMSKISEELDDLNELVDPKTAAFVLNIEKMRNEIIAREKFQNNIVLKLQKIDTTLSRSENRFDTLFYWILGLFATMVTSLLGLIAYLLKSK